MSLSKTSTRSNRDRLIQLIHVGKRDLHLDDDTYRHLLTSTTGKNSTKVMTMQQLNDVLATMKDRGFVVKIKKVAGSRPQAKDPQSQKIRALWLALHSAGQVQDATEAALANYVKRITGVDALQWLSAKQACTVIETLKQWQSRIG